MLKKAMLFVVSFVLLHFTNFSRRIDKKGAQTAVLTMTLSIFLFRTSTLNRKSPLRKHRTIPSYFISLSLYCTSCKHLSTQLLFKESDISLDFLTSMLRTGFHIPHHKIFLSLEHGCTQFFLRGLMFSF